MKIEGSVIEMNILFSKRITIANFTDSELIKIEIQVQDNINYDIFETKLLSEIEFLKIK